MHSGSVRQQLKAGASAFSSWASKTQSALRQNEQDMEPGEIGSMLRHPAAGSAIRSLVDSFPRLALDAHLHPITRRAVAC